MQAADITPRIGVIEIYGAHKTSLEKIQSAIQARKGDVLPSRGDVEERIDKIPGILGSRVEAACCDNSAMVLYVGVEERDDRHFDFHPVPTGTDTLPPDLVASYHAFLDAVAGSIRGKNADEDLTNGYSLMADPECRQIQLSFIPAAEKNLSLLDKVVRDAGDSEQRAIAAYLLQYGPRGPHTSRTVVNALQWALQDQDDTVRENAMRALKAVAVGAKLHPDQEISVEPTWFVELMNSIVWSDRRNASLALVNLTENRNPETLNLLRERALPSVIEMAKWHDLQHALPAFILAGRLAGLDERQIQQAWVSGDRDAVLEKAAHPNSKPSGLFRKHG